MSRLITILVLGLVLCVAVAGELQAGCCILWNEYGWATCSSGVANAGDCADIGEAGEWDHSYYDAGCSCFDQWPYYIGTEDEGLWRYVIVGDCIPELDDEGHPVGDHRERYLFGKGWSSFLLDPPRL